MNALEMGMLILVLLFVVLPTDIYLAARLCDGKINEQDLEGADALKFVLYLGAPLGSIIFVTCRSVYRVSLWLSARIKSFNMDRELKKMTDQGAHS